MEKAIYPIIDELMFSAVGTLRSIVLLKLMSMTDVIIFHNIVL
jgi:hypothetical protein